MGVTKNFFQAKPWTEILADQGYRNLAQRELEVLRRFTTEFSTHRETVVHLGVGGFREIPYIIESVKPCMYVVNDIVEEVANSVATEGQKVYPEISFRAICADLDHPDTIKVLHKQAIIGTMFILAGNGVIFANRELDQRIATVMNSCDLFMVTVETPHDNLAANYRIPACYELLSQSGLDVREDTAISVKSEAKREAGIYK